MTVLKINTIAINFFLKQHITCFGLVGPSPGNCGSAQLDFPEIKGHPEQLLFDASYSQV